MQIEIPAQAGQVLETVQPLFGGSLLGFYLYGSATYGGLHPDSDVDLLAVLDRPMTDTERKSLTAALLACSGRVGCADKRPLEVTVVDHTAASGFPWSAGGMQSTGDVIADLTEDLAAEQKARVTYDNILRLSDDPDVNNVIRFLREREIVHFQRFGECLRLCKEKMDTKNVYFTNPAFDSSPAPQPRTGMAKG